MKPGAPLTRRTPLRARAGLQRGGPIARGEGAQRGGRVPQERTEPRRAVAKVARVVRAAGGKFSRPVRDLMFRRCGGLCECCGGPLPEKGWTAQHRRARGMGGTRRTMTAADGIAVHDRPCHHEVIEAHPERAAIMGWRVHQADDPETAPLVLPDRRRVLLTIDGRYVDLP